MKKLLWFVLISLASAELYAGPVEQLEAFIKTNRHDKVVELITEKKVDVNCTLRGGFSPLDWALTVNNQATINFLIEHGAQATGEDLSSYDTGVYVPKTTRPEQAVSHSPQRVQRANSHQSDLRAAVLNDDESKAMECIFAGASLEGTRGKELLKLALNTNKFQIMTWLMDQGITLATETFERPRPATSNSGAQQPTNTPSSSPVPPADPSSNGIESALSFPLIGTLDTDDLPGFVPFAEAMAEEVVPAVSQKTPVTYERPVYEEITPGASYQVRYQARLRNTLRVFEEILEGTEARIRGERIPREPAEHLRKRAKEEVVERIETIRQRDKQAAHDLYNKALSSRSSKKNIIAAFQEAGFPLLGQRTHRQRYTAGRKRHAKRDYDTHRPANKEMTGEARDNDDRIKNVLQELLQVLAKSNQETAISKIRTIVDEEPEVAKALLRKAVEAQHDCLIMLLMEGGISLQEYELRQKQPSASGNKRKSASSTDARRSKQTSKKMRSASSASAWESWFKEAALKAQEAKKAPTLKNREWTSLDWAYYNKNKAEIQKLKNEGARTSFNQSDVATLLSKYGCTDNVDFDEYYSEFIEWSGKFNQDMPLELVWQQFAHLYTQRATGGEDPFRKRQELAHDWQEQEVFLSTIDNLILAHYINAEIEKTSK